VETKHILVAGSVIEKNGKILLVQEKKDIAKGKWNIPAGHLDSGETIFNTAKRETEEETGFTIELKDIVGIYQYPSVRDNTATVFMVVFRGSILHGEIKFPPEEILDVKWFKPEEVLKMKDSQLRGIRLIIEDFLDNKSYPLNVIKEKD